MNCKIQLPVKLLRAVACACSKDSTRYVLQNVQVNFRKGRIVIVATNGRTLLAAVVEKVEHDLAGKSFLIPSSLLKYIKDWEETVTVEVDGDYMYLREDGLHGLSVSKKVDDPELVRYPNWKQVVPKGKLTPHSCAISYEVAETLFSAMTIFRRKQNCSISGYCFEGEVNGPHICHITDDMFALYMPFRDDERKMVVPNWLLGE